MDLTDMLKESGSAWISECGKYRYLLTRRWGDPIKDVITFVMLNPSTATAEQDDPTIRRCIGFAKKWGASGLVVANLFAYRATDPGELRKQIDPVGPENDHALRLAALAADRVIAAWGVLPPSPPWMRERGEKVRRLLKEYGQVEALRLGADGQPHHPLYLPGSLQPVHYAGPRPLGEEV